MLRLGAGPSIHYVLRDATRGVEEMPVYRVTPQGTLQSLGTLLPVRPDGFVMRQGDGALLHSHGLPWWLYDACPQGFLGRVFAEHHAAALGLPARLQEWSDTHVLRALLAFGHDVVGNLLLGDIARERFLTAPAPQAVSLDAYADLAAAAERGELPGSFAGGEQPKFMAFNGQHHVLVKFTAAADNAVARRWRDLLLAEHLAARTLLESGVAAAESRVLDAGGRRFLEVQRFDRVGEAGRRALHSLTSVEAEFVGAGPAPWPVLAARLADQGVITEDAAATAALLYAFGTLIGNTDMHNGNLSFMAEHERPYRIAPAYDMLPMGFAPRTSGVMSDTLPPARLHPDVSPGIWRQALVLAERFVESVRGDDRFSEDWQPCATALQQHLANAATMLARLA